MEKFANGLGYAIGLLQAGRFFAWLAFQRYRIRWQYRRDPMLQAWRWLQFMEQVQGDLDRLDRLKHPERYRLK